MSAREDSEDSVRREKKKSPPHWSSTSSKSTRQAQRNVHVRSMLAVFRDEKIDWRWCYCYLSLEQVCLCLIDKSNQCRRCDGVFVLMRLVASFVDVGILLTPATWKYHLKWINVWRHQSHHGASLCIFNKRIFAKNRELIPKNRFPKIHSHENNASGNLLFLESISSRNVIGEFMADKWVNIIDYSEVPRSVPPRGVQNPA